LALAPHAAPLVARCLAAGPPPLALALRAASPDAAWRLAGAALRLSECGLDGGAAAPALRLLRHPNARARWAAAALAARALGLGPLPQLLRRCCSEAEELGARLAWEEEEEELDEERARWFLVRPARRARARAPRRLFVKQRAAPPLRPVAARRPQRAQPEDGWRADAIRRRP